MSVIGTMCTVHVYGVFSLNECYQLASKQKIANKSLKL